MRIVFIGAVEFSRRVLQRLVETGADVVGVCTLKESIYNSDHVDLGILCEAQGIPWVYTPDVNSDEAVRWIGDKAPDVIFCFGWSRLLRRRLLDLAPLGVVGFHPAGLPANRGRHPIIWSLILGLRETATTFFFMDEGADTGDILYQSKVEIVDEDNATTLYEKVIRCALNDCETLVDELASGSFSRTPQDERRANTWRKRSEMDGKIDWRMSARSIHNLVRGLTKPYPGARFDFQGKEYTVWETEVVSGVPQNAEPGKILEVAATGPVVKTGEYGIRLVQADPFFRVVPGEYL